MFKTDIIYVKNWYEIDTEVIYDMFGSGHRVKINLWYNNFLK